MDKEEEREIDIEGEREKERERHIEGLPTTGRLMVRCSATTNEHKQRYFTANSCFKINALSGWAGQRGSCRDRGPLHPPRSTGP